MMLWACICFCVVWSLADVHVHFRAFFFLVTWVSTALCRDQKKRDRKLAWALCETGLDHAEFCVIMSSALDQEPAEPVLDEFCHVGQKRERERLDMTERRLHLEEGVHRLEESKRGNALEHTSTAIKLIKSFMVLDERTSLQFKDHIKNVILSSGRSF